MATADHDGEPDRKRPEDAEDYLPPSARFVRYVLQNHGPLTCGEISDESTLPKRTVRYALGELEDAGEVGWNPGVDARTKVWHVRAE